MCKKLLSSLIILVLGVTASAFDISQNFDGLAAGDLNGQGGGTGWSGNWYGNSGGEYKVVGTTDKNIEMNKVGTTMEIYRDFASGINPVNDDYFLEWKFKKLGALAPALAWNNAFQLMVQSGSSKALYLKFIGISRRIDLNNSTNLGNFANGGGVWRGTDDNVEFKIKIGYTAATTTYKLYWEKVDGSMGLRATVIGHNDAISGNLDTLRLRGPNLNNGYDGNGIQLDNLVLNPEPATVILLGLGALGLVRRKR